MPPAALRNSRSPDASSLDASAGARLGGGVGGVCLVRVQVELEFGVGARICGAFFGRLGVGVVACVLTYKWWRSVGMVSVLYMA